LPQGGVIAIDGKSLKGAYENGEKSSPRMMVSANATGLRFTLATVAAKERNEVDAALEVIGLSLASIRASLTAKLKQAGWNDEFLLKLLSQMR
jgi:hypothetical protein